MFLKETSVKTLSYYLLVAVTLLLSVICIFYQLNHAFTKPEKPIKPTNPISSTATTKSSQSSTELSTDEKSSATTATTKSSKVTSTSSSSKKEAKPGTTSPLNLILTATLDSEEKGEEEGEDIIRTYLVKEPIEQNGFDVKINQVTLAKLTEESMKSTGYTGEGILDVQLELDNQSTENVTIFPEQIKLEVNGTETPVTLNETFKETTMNPSETLTESFLTTFPSLGKVDDIQEFSFTWVREINKAAQLFNVTIILVDK